MQDVSTSAAFNPSDDRTDGHRLIVSELMSLIEHVRSSMRLIESVIATESPPDDEVMASEFVILDDVTPFYAHANAALDSCDSGLRSALRIVRAAKAPGQVMDEAIGWFPGRTDDDHVHV
jgi:hypothetical protein